LKHDHVLFQLSFDGGLLKKFWFMKRIISPILETYYVAACRLTLLQQAEMPGAVTVRTLTIIVLLAVTALWSLIFCWRRDSVYWPVICALISVKLVCSILHMSQKLITAVDFCSFATEIQNISPPKKNLPALTKCSCCSIAAKSNQPLIYIFNFYWWCQWAASV